MNAIDGCRSMEEKILWYLGLVRVANNARH